MFLLIKNKVGILKKQKHQDIASVLMYSFIKSNIFLSIAKMYTRMFPEAGLNIIFQINQNWIVFCLFYINMSKSILKELRIFKEKS